MKRRKILLLSAAAVLGCVLALQAALGAAGKVRTAEFSGDPDAISIRTGGTELALRRDGGRWTVGGRDYPADEGRVAALIDAARKVSVLEKVSSGGDGDRFGLAEGSSTIVSLSAGGKELRKIEIGKAASAARQTYVRLDGAADVILVSGDLRQAFGTTQDALRDKKIFDLKPEEISGVSVRGAEAFGIEKTGTPAAWNLVFPSREANRALDGAAVDSWIAQIATLRADSFAAEGSIPGGEPLISVSLKASGGDASLTIHAKDGDRYLCSSSASPYPFYLAEYAAERFMKPLDELVKR